AGRVGRHARRLAAVQRGLRDHRVPGGGAPGPGVAPAGAGGGADVGRGGRGLRGTCPGGRGDRGAGGATAVPDVVLQPRVRRWVRGRVLLLHLVGGAQRGDGRVVPRERGPAARERRPVPRRAALARRLARPDGRLPCAARPRPAHRAAARAPGPRGLTYRDVHVGPAHHPPHRRGRGRTPVPG